MTTYVTMSANRRRLGGYWGLGDSEVIATKECKMAGGAAPFYVYRVNDEWEKVWVDDLAGFHATLKSEFRDLSRADYPPIIAEITRVGARGKRVDIPLDVIGEMTPQPPQESH